MTNAFNFGPELDAVAASVKQIAMVQAQHTTKLDALTLQQEKIMTVLTDLQDADAKIQAAVANAVTLIQSLHTNPGSVTDAEVEAEVANLTAAAAALSGATPQP